MTRTSRPRRPVPALLGATTVTACLAVTVSGLSAATTATASESAAAKAPRPYSVGLFGDMPYGEYGRAKYPNVIADMNSYDLAFSVFDGDTKNGSEPCYADPHAPDPAAVTPDRAVADASHPDVYKQTLGLFDLFRDPVVYLPGDNEWTDCDRTSTQGGAVSDSSDRLGYLRALSYPTDRSLGRRTIRLTRQSAAYPENVLWSKGPVTFVGLNVPGSDNNYADGARNGPAAQGQAEYTARNAANLAWLRNAFAAAKAAGSKAVVIVIQADMWDPQATTTHFADTKRELLLQTTAYDGKVVLVNGDSHRFVVDKPLTDEAATNAGGEDGPNVVENFTRITTFGEDDNHWVRATIDVRDPDVVSVRQMLVPANLPAYTVSGR